MTRISSRPIKEGIANKISNHLITYIASIKTKKESKKFLNELLSDSERLLLAKRLAIVIMLEHGHSYVTIEKTLSVSSNTISRISHEKDNGRYHFVEKRSEIRNGIKKVNDRDGLDAIEKILLAGMPPRGKGRWNFLNELTEDKRKERLT